MKAEIQKAINKQQKWVDKATKEYGSLNQEVLIVEAQIRQLIWVLKLLEEHKQLSSNEGVELIKLFKDSYDLQEERGDKPTLWHLNQLRNRIKELALIIGSNRTDSENQLSKGKEYKQSEEEHHKCPECTPGIVTYLDGKQCPRSNFGFKAIKGKSEPKEEETEKMLIEIVGYKYKSCGFPYAFLDYSMSNKVWQITWRNPIEFSNSEKTNGKTPNEACKKALKFIKDNPNIFKPIK